MAYCNQEVSDNTKRSVRNKNILDTAIRYTVQNIFGHSVGEDLILLPDIHPYMYM